ncbi:MAG: hypothetical protein KKI09_16275 [Spirochaetes bacterium]|nr:hypothetical protein [Spirochaetota bacterium]MBU0956980.1 hypothetical protein [Spirochaetota bacterium]
MATTAPQPLCRTCLAARSGVQIQYNSNSSQNIPQSGATARGDGRGYGSAVHLSSGSKSLMRAGLVVLNLALGVIALGFWAGADSPVMLLPFAVSIFAHFPLSRWLYGRREPERTGKAAGRARKKQNDKKITAAQVESLLRISGGRITAARLASATGTDSKKAEQFLNMMVLDSKLQIENDADGLVYSRNNLLS